MRAFLVGAGATTACNPHMPLDNNFFNSLRRGDKTHYRKLVEVLSRRFPEYDEKNLVTASLEKVIIDSDQLHESEKIVFKDTILRALYNRIVKPSAGTKVDELLRQSGEGAELYTQYDSLIRHSKSSNSDFFINLNYDFLLDQAIWRSRKRDSQIIEPCQIDYALDDFQLDDSMMDSDSIRVSESGIKTVFKLHGSFNWLEFDNQIEIKPYAPSPDQYQNILILPPTAKNTERIESVWKKARERLVRANELIVIGCSLSKNDKELHNLIKSWVDNNDSNNVKVVTKCTKEEEDYYKEIFGKNVNIYSEGFDYQSIEFIYNGIEN